MSNVVLFTDITPKNIGTTDDSWYLEYSTRPAGAYAIASHLRQLGFSVLVVPYCSKLTLTGVKQIIDNQSRDLLWAGLSTSLLSASSNLESYRQIWHQSTQNTMSNFFETRNHKNWVNKSSEVLWASNEINAIAGYLKQKYHVPFLVGGAWVSNIANGNLSNLEDNVHVVNGRAEDFVQKFSYACQHKQPLPLINNNDNYDNFDFKDRIYEWNEQDFLESTDWLPIEVSRGCAFNCAFCTYDRKSTTDNYRSPEVIRQEIVKNYEKFGITKFILMDDLYNDSKDKVRILYDKVWSKLPFQPEWTSYMRLDMIYADPESAEILKKSGARMASFGIETLHPKAGRRVGKGLGKQRILDTLAWLKNQWKNDVLIHAMFIMGLPDEPEHSMQETIEWLRETDLIHSYTASPMWITPPAHKSFVLKINAIAEDNQKYGIQWLNDTNWINQQGMTFEKANALTQIANSDPRRLSTTFSDYVEFRKMGLTHDQIVDFKSTGMSVVRDRVLNNNKANNQLLQKFLTLKCDQ